MSNELNGSFNLNCQNGEYRDQFQKSILADQAAQGAAGGIQLIPFTSADLLDFSNLAGGTYGYLVLHNCEDVGGNFVQWGPDQTGSMVTVGRLYPGEIAFIRVEPGVGIRAQADTGRVHLEYWLLSA